MPFQGNWTWSRLPYYKVLEKPVDFKAHSRSKRDGEGRGRRSCYPLSPELVPKWIRKTTWFRGGYYFLMQLVPHPIKDQIDEFENHWACLSQPPFSPPGNELPLGIRRFLELLQSMGFPACVWQGTSIPSSGGINRPKLCPASWLLSASPLSSFSNHSEPGQGKGELTRFRTF